LKKIYLLSSTKFQNTVYFPTIQIRFLEKKLNLSEIDILIFTSKNGVKAINLVSENWKNIPALAIGKKSFDEIVKYGGDAIPVSSKSYSKYLVKTILKNYSDKKILYIRPKIVASNIVEILEKENIDIFETILYETLCLNKKDKIDSDSIIIATSPSTIRCLLKNIIPENSIFIAIGKTTFDAIPERFQRYIAPIQTIQSCIESAKKLI